MAVLPAGLERRHVLADGRRVTIRPIRPEDGPAERAFLERLCAESLRMRFMKFVGSVGEPLVRQFTHVDYARTMAFVCEADGALVGEARYGALEPGSTCDFGIVIDDAWHKSGIAGLLMLALLDYARSQGFSAMDGLVLRENRTMLRFVRALGFEVLPTAEPTVVQVVKALQPAAA